MLITYLQFHELCATQLTQANPIVALQEYSTHTTLMHTTTTTRPLRNHAIHKCDFWRHLRTFLFQSIF